MAQTKKPEKEEEKKPLTLNQKAALRNKDESPETEQYEVVQKCFLHGKWQPLKKILNLTEAQANLYVQQSKLKKVRK